MPTQDDRLLDKANAEAASEMIGGVIFVAVMIVIGLIGNLYVLFVYIFYMKRSNRRLFILVLGSLDLLTCVTAMPFIIYDLSNPLKFRSVAACKVFRFNNYCICTTSFFVFLVIAIDGFRKVCRPLCMQIPGGLAKVLCMFCVVLAIMFSFPAPVLFGIKPVITANVTGMKCAPEPVYVANRFMAYFNIAYICLALSVSIVITILYSFMWRVIHAHLALRSQLGVVQFTKPGKPSTGKAAVYSIPSSGTIYRSSSSPRLSYQTTTDASKRTYEDIRRTKSNRTSMMFFIITIILFFSFLPHFTMKIIAFVVKDFYPNMSHMGKVLYNTFIWCFFVNNVANPIVYLLFDTTFRVKVQAIYEPIFSCLGEDRCVSGRNGSISSSESDKL